MGRTNFTQCAIDYIGNQTLADLYGWKGPVVGIEINRTSQITEKGCYQVCGHGDDYYSWSSASSTITTWLLPVLGVLLQAPFESNAFWRTMFAIARWVGSPMVSLSYILWNIAVSGKCAMMGESFLPELLRRYTNISAVDMAVSYNDRSPFDDSDLGSIRDSFFILMNMNQFIMKPMAKVAKEAEGLLRIVLFSKDLRLLGTDKKLKEVRKELAQTLRERRRRGVVPVFISTGWFLFSLAISIQGAFGQLGQNAEAHDLALGLLLGWLPILIMCSIIDRNPVAADDVRRQINKTIDMVAYSLGDEIVRAEFINTIHLPDKAAAMTKRVEQISAKIDFLAGDFFKSFGGQGRVRWHYGAAQPILSDLENCYLAERGRNWLHNEPEARTELVLGSIDRGLFFFDFRQLWQITSSVIIVAGSALGAFILSYYTPTVGLGCRSLGYLIFCIFSLTLLILEFVVWWLSSPEREQDRLEQRHAEPAANRLRRSTTIQNIGAASHNLIQRSKATLRRRRDGLEGWLLDTLPPILVRIYYPRRKRSRKTGQVRQRLQRQLEKYRDFGLRDWSERLFFRPLEFVNMGWLFYISMAQTFGSYNNCRCQCSVYGKGGGYIDLNLVNQAPPDFVYGHWKTGTIMACIIMGMTMVYVVLEWCLQSHLSTEDPNNARKGLQRTRRFRRLIQPIRYSMVVGYFAINNCFGLLLRPFRERGKGKQKSLVWTHDITYPYPPRARVPGQDGSSSPDTPLAEGGSELPSYSSHKPFSHRSSRRYRSESYVDPADSSATIPLVVEPDAAYTPVARDFSQDAARTPSGSSINSEVDDGAVGPLEATPFASPPQRAVERSRELTSYPRQWGGAERYA